MIDESFIHVLSFVVGFLKSGVVCSSATHCASRQSCVTQNLNVKHHTPKRVFVQAKNRAIFVYTIFVYTIFVYTIFVYTCSFGRYLLPTAFIALFSVLQFPLTALAYILLICRYRDKFANGMAHSKQILCPGMRKSIGGQAISRLLPW